MPSLEERFQKAVTLINTSPKASSLPSGFPNIDNNVKLEFYGYFKQATIGKCTTSKPGFFDMTGRYKWDAWNKLGDMSSDDAMKAYVEKTLFFMKQYTVMSNEVISDFIQNYMSEGQKEAQVYFDGLNEAIEFLESS